jgi:hypothetical protein
MCVAHMTLEATRASNSGGHALAGVYAGVIQFFDVIFGPSTLAHMYAAGNGTVNAIGDYTISGGSEYHIDCGAYGVVILSESGPTGAVNVTLTGTPNFSNCFAGVEAGYVACPQNNFSGAATGLQFSIAAFGVIDTQGRAGGPGSYLTGSIADTVPSPNGGGCYV